MQNVKETVRKFRVTTELVVNTKSNPEVTEEGVREGVKNLMFFGLEQADEQILLGADIIDIQEEDIC